MFCVFPFPARDDDQRYRSRFDPRFRTQHDFPLGLGFGDHDRIQADILHSHAVRQPANINGNPAFETISTLNRNNETGFLSGPSSRCTLAVSAEILSLRVNCM